MPESGLESGDLWGGSPSFTTGATVFVSSPSLQGFNAEISNHRRRGNPNGSVEVEADDAMEMSSMKVMMDFLVEVVGWDGLVSVSPDGAARW
ncbi:hypothetical protein V6N12_013751 [Hibiscus sabdariffa]|uniref:Uncharacterized protein n=1 Tax=Hibiscus sabdariffa TaxID=183260 RepID=A0ABR2CV41_9ROSI